jgi:hypothetical protein
MLDAIARHPAAFVAIASKPGFAAMVQSPAFGAAISSKAFHAATGNMKGLTLK